jgi:hypothetical protein
MKIGDLSQSTNVRARSIWAKDKFVNLLLVLCDAVISESS